MEPLSLALIARIPEAGIAGFQAYEDHVLPWIGEHGGTLQRRLRNREGTIEIHLVVFSSREGFEQFRCDPRRVSVQPLLAASGATTEVIEVHDVAPI